VAKVQLPDNVILDVPDDATDDEINALVSQITGEKVVGVAPQQQQAPRQPKQGFFDKLGRGAARLPQLLTSEDARSTFATGAVRGVQSLGSGVADLVPGAKETAVAGIGTALGMGSFKDNFAKAQADSKQLREEQGLANFTGEIIGLGLGGRAIGKAVDTGSKALRAGKGAKLGVAGEAFTVTAAQSLGKNVERGEELDAAEAATSGVIAAAGGKLLEIGLNRAAKPILEYIVPRLERVRAAKGAKATAEFKIPEQEIAALASQIDEPVDVVRAEIQRYQRAFGESPDLLAVLGRKSVENIEQLAGARPNLARALQAAEEQGLQALPEQVARGVSRTGPTSSRAAALSDVDASATRATGDVEEQLARRQAETTQLVRDEGRAITRAEKAQKAALESDITREGQQMSDTVRRTAANIASDARVEDELSKYVSNVMRGANGIAKQPVRLSSDWLAQNFPENPSAIGAVLRKRIDTLPAGQEREALVDAMDALGVGNEIVLPVEVADNLRRFLSKPVDVAGTTIELQNVAKSLRDEIGNQYPVYQDAVIDAFRATQRGLEARALGGKTTGAGSASAADELALSAENARAGIDLQAIRQGAREGALSAILGTSKNAEAALRTAANMVDNAEELTAAGVGDLVEMSRKVLANVQKIRDEIADVAEAAQLSREAASDSLAPRLEKLRRTAKAQIDALNARFAKDRDAIRAADNILNTRGSEFNAAVSGSGRSDLGRVALGGIADDAAQGSGEAIGVARQLREASTGRKVAQVTDKETADRLADIGALTERQVANRSIAAARVKKENVISSEVGIAMEVAASAFGRAGPGYQTAILKRFIELTRNYGISDKAGKAMVDALVRRDGAYLENVINRLGKTKEIRKQIASALNRAATGAAAATVGEASRDPDE
jgi:hypothetical protein